jgi:1-deoxyxylulose-5-phosphate synthase
MLRRDFLHRSSRAAAGALLASRSLVRGLAAIPPLSQKFAATDTVTLGNTGIKTSRLAMGTGTVGAGRHSHQTALGMDGLPRLLLHGYGNGLRLFDAADSYGSHPHVAEALKHVDRSKVTVLTKSWARDPKEMTADIERFRSELGIEQIDIVLMHCLTEADWTTRYRPVMDVLEDAKQRKVIRAHGCSCHSIEALRAAAKSPWVDVDLARLNPVGAHMDADPDTVVSVLREMKAAGKAVLGMKILGQGALRDRQDEALRFALGLNVLDAFTIGAESIAEQNDLVRRIAAAA